MRAAAGGGGRGGGGRRGGRGGQSEKVGSERKRSWCNLFNALDSIDSKSLQCILQLLVVCSSFVDNLSLPPGCTLIVSTIINNVIKTKPF